MTSKRELSLKQVGECRWELAADHKEGMRVPGIVFADEKMVQQIAADQALEQVANVAFLPGIVYASLAMPDIHWGYGFPVGGVAATRIDGGVISPGGVGFDINCGVRLLRTDLTEEDVRPRVDELAESLFRNVPSGVGSRGKLLLRSDADIDEVMIRGAAWAVDRGFGDPDDVVVTEEEGAIQGAQPDAVSQRARERGAPQLGTLGSGNHFLEVQVVDEIFDVEAAEAMGITQSGQVAIMMHCGSRGLGHQVCTDYLKLIDQEAAEYEIYLPDRQLAAAPLDSPEGTGYLGAMRCAANYAWANRQCITHWTREAFQQVFELPWQQLGIWQVYDVAHNVAKIETHLVDGENVELCVHRKGATRSFPPGSPDLPERYAAVGQPVIIPGDMGRYSFLAVAGPEAMTSSFGSTCHGAGRAASRGAARRMLQGRDIQRELASRGIVLKAHGNKASVAEEASEAYKDVAEVVEVCQQAGLSLKVARMRPMAVIKG